MTLSQLCGIEGYDVFRESHRRWVEELIANGRNSYDSKWTRSTAVGVEGFVQGIKGRLGVRGKGRNVVEAGESYQLREPQLLTAAFWCPKMTF